MLPETVLLEGTEEELRSHHPCLMCSRATPDDIQSLPKVHQPWGRESWLCGELPKYIFWTVQENIIPPPQARAAKSRLKGAADKQPWECHPSRSPNEWVVGLQFLTAKTSLYQPSSLPLAGHRCLQLCFFCSCSVLASGAAGLSLG